MVSKIPAIFLTGSPGCGKTTLIQSLLVSLDKDVLKKGFYTEECLKGGNRIGFDILYWTDNDQNPKRQSLSRMVDKVKKHQASVGKYLVNVPNIQNFAIPSLASANNNNNNNNAVKKELVIVDEVGKMEMLCPQFIPAVTKLLDDTSSSAETTRLVVGTLPTPRYGRVIQAVEDIRARDDVVVLHVTKSNREKLKDTLRVIIKNAFDTKNVNLQKELKEFLYTRAIGASSMNGYKQPISTKPLNKDKVALTETPSILKPCGPLMSNTVQPKVLILGGTASPLPSNDAYSYCERSMWIVLGKIENIKFKPIKDITSASKDEMKAFQTLRQIVINKGICIWDVYADVHEKTGRKRKRGRKTQNKIDDFLKKNPSIERIGFIGHAARSNFQTSSKVELMTLPSSSPANSHLSLEEKAEEWKRSLNIGD